MRALRQIFPKQPRPRSYIFIYIFIYLIMYIYILCRNIYIYITYPITPSGNQTWQWKIHEPLQKKSLTTIRIVGHSPARHSPAHCCYQFFGSALVAHS